MQSSSKCPYLTSNSHLERGSWAARHERKLGEVRVSPGDKALARHVADLGQLHLDDAALQLVALKLVRGRAPLAVVARLKLKPRRLAPRRVREAERVGVGAEHALRADRL